MLSPENALKQSVLEDISKLPKNICDRVSFLVKLLAFLRLLLWGSMFQCNLFSEHLWLTSSEWHFDFYDVETFWKSEIRNKQQQVHLIELMLLLPFQDTYILKQHPDHLCLCFNFLKIWETMLIPGSVLLLK